MFKKGQSGNPSGRPKGAKGEKGRIWAEVSDWFVNEGLEAYTENLEDMLTSGNPIKKAEGMKHFNALLEYFKPKLSRTDSQIQHKGDIPITINKKYNESKNE